MNHIYRLFAVLLLLAVGSVTSVAQLTEGYYRIQSKKDNKFVVNNGTDLAFSASSQPTTSNLSEIWKVVPKSGGGYNLINAASGLGVLNQTTLYRTHTLGQPAGLFYIQNTASGYNICNNSSFSGNTCWHHDSYNRVVIWAASSPDSYWTMTQVTAPEEITAADANLALRSNRVVRLKSNTGKYAAVTTTGAVTLLNTPDATNRTDVWAVEVVGDRNILRNYNTGLSLSTDGTATTALTTRLMEVEYYIIPTPQDVTKCYIGRSNTLTQAQFLAATTNGNVVVQAAVDANNVSQAVNEWTLEPVSDLSFETAKTTIRSKFGYVAAPESGKNYRLVSRHYLLHATGSLMAGNVTAKDADNNDYAQVWTVAGSGSSFSFQNTLTDQYLQNNGSRSGDFTMGANTSAFRFVFYDRVVPYFGIVGSQQAVHCAATQGYRLVGWDESSDASKWYLQTAEVDATALAAAKARIGDKLQIDNQRETINTTLATFFTDGACTQLKPEYSSLSDDQLRNAMGSLPLSVKEMAVRVKNNRWNPNNTSANSYEKDFRIAAYKAHSDPYKWAQRPLLPVMVAYSQLTNPTGISARKGDVALLFVDQDIPAGTTLRAELVYGFDKVGTQVDLQKGINALYFDRDQHIYIYYNVNDTATVLNTIPDMRIHIEGGYANGCFNLERHNNNDWTALKNLKSEGFLQDEVFRIKSRRQCFSFHRAGIENQESQGNWNDYDGTYKGIVGVIGKWDEITDQELHFLSVDRYANRFNCLLFASSASTSSPYASTHGTWYPGVSTIFSYKELTRGRENDEAGNRWAVAHEIGHQFQQMFNLAGCLESSNNLFSQIIVWNTGSNVSRGAPFKEIAAKFNTGKNWIDYGIGDRIRPYWQLWLYFVELKHKPTFYQELIDKLRVTPINQSNADTDFLHFARLCADVAQEDLTEFFTMHGFFNIADGTHTMRWNDDFYDSHYALPNIVVRAADIEKTKQHMKQYPKKGANNLYFLDDRIKPIPATYPGAPEGVMKLATSWSATPGDASEVGEVGMYTDFAPEKATVAKPARVELIDRTVRVQGEGAVGYKVYNKDGELMFCSNYNTFVLPENLTEYVVKVAGGNGADVQIIKDGIVEAAYNLPVVENNFVNTAELSVSSDKQAPEYLYTIQNTGNQRFVTTATAPTTNASEAGKFAFFPANGAGQYRIATITAEGRVSWLTCPNMGEGSNKVGFSTQFGDAAVWTIERESNGTSFDIIAGTQPTNNSWNWHGGVFITQNSMGLYSKTDANSSWSLTINTLNNQLAVNIKAAKTLEAIKGPGYPTLTSAARSNFRTAIATAESKWMGTTLQADIDALAAAVTAYTSTSTELTPIENGKVYRVRHYADGRYITNETVKIGKTSYTLTLSHQTTNATLWVCQVVNGKYRFVSVKDNRYMTRNRNTYIGAVSTTPGDFEVGKGDQFGAFYLRVNSASYSASIGKAYMEMVSLIRQGNSTGTWGTDFYFEEVENTNANTSAMSMDDLLTPVESIVAPEGENAPLYDLTGRRVTRPISGQIYLQGGRKVLFQ